MQTPGEYKHSQHETPKVTVDIIIETEGGIVMISRKNEPFGWALPGGFVDIGEKTIDAAAREALEETGLIVDNLLQFHTYSDPARDPRGHGITIVYIGRAQGMPVAADDAKQAMVVRTQDELDALTVCFDHREIIEDYTIFQNTGRRPTRE